MSTDLTRKSTIREMVGVYQSAVATIRASFAALDDAEARLNAEFSYEDYRTVRIDHGDHRPCFVRWGESERAVAQLRRRIWYIIVERLELQRMMSESRWSALRADLDNGDLPDITEENISSFLRANVAAMPEMSQEMVMEVFEWLRPRSNTAAAKLKTNGRFEVGRKVIVEALDSTWLRLQSTWHVHHYQARKLLALENVFNALDGRGNVAKTYNGELCDAINATPWTSSSGETDMFRFRLYKNNRVHLEFKRTDLLARFNQIAGGKRLKT